MLETDKVIKALLSFQRRCWEHGEAMQALYEFGAMDELVIMAKQAIVMSLPDGRPCVQNVDEAELVTDPCCAGEGLLAAYHYTGDEQFRIAYEKLKDYALHQAPRNREGIVYHVTRAPQFWLDSLYMLPPFLAVAGEYQEALRQIDGFWDMLYDPEKQLMHWMWDDSQKKVVWPNFRSICNGFAIAGMERVALLLPKEMNAEKQDLVRRTMLGIAVIAGKACGLLDGYDDVLRYHRKTLVTEPDAAEHRKYEELREIFLEARSCLTNVDHRLCEWTKRKDDVQ